MAVVMKSIKPKKIRLDVFRLETLSGMNEIASGMKEDFESTTASWKRKVKFVTLKSLRGGNLEVLVGTDDEIYGYVDKGTRPHVIRPKVAKSLAFPGGPYSPKTTPNVIGSTAGGSSGSTVHAMSVNHPGTKARNFDTLISRRWQPRFKRRMELAMRIAAAKSGHGI